MISISQPAIGEEEKAAVCKVLDSGMINSGEVVKEFQDKFASYIKVKYAVATSSGTTALEVALRAAGIGKGDKVLTTPFSFVASTNTILYVGGVPVFADINPTSFNIDPSLMEERLQADPQIKALLIVHLFGHPCDMSAIMALVKKYKLLLIEDCAQSHGAMYKGAMTGSFGDVSTFSFYPTKNMTTSEGGLVATNNPNIAEKAALLINHGMKTRYYHDIIGYNYRMTNIAAAIGLCQLDKLDGFNAKRIQTAHYYGKNIQNKNIIAPCTPPPFDKYHHCFHQYSIRVKDGKRETLLKHLQANKIGYGVFYPLSIPEQACFKDHNFDTNYPVTNQIKQEIVSIPIHPGLTQEEIKTVTTKINQFND